jgi:hypothetical protein
MINFPNDPEINDIFTAAGKSWRWDGVAWVVTPTPEGWVRPAEWLPMPEIDPTEDKFAGLIAVYDNDWNYVELGIQTTEESEFTVDWGDGTVEDFSIPAFSEGPTVAIHQYDYTDEALTDTSYGYKMAMVIVTPVDYAPEETPRWTYFSLQENALPGGDAFRDPVNWLDIVFSGPNVTTLKIGLED